MAYDDCFGQQQPSCGRLSHFRWESSWDSSVKTISWLRTRVRSAGQGIEVLENARSFFWQNGIIAAHATSFACNIILLTLVRQHHCWSALWPLLKRRAALRHRSSAYCSSSVASGHCPGMSPIQTSFGLLRQTDSALSPKISLHWSSGVHC